jgi:hypothetical protein
MRKLTDGRTTARWIGQMLLLAAVGAVGGWFLPRGLNLLGGKPIPDDPLVRFLAAAVLFGLSTAVSVMLWAHSRAELTAAELDRTLRDGLHEQGREIMESAVFRALLPQAANTQREAAILGEMVRRYGQLVAEIPKGLLSAYFVLVEAELAELTEEVRAISSSAGKPVTIRQHLQITRRLVEDHGSFLQINRRAFNAPEEWTHEWLGLVHDLGAAGISPEYVVLMRQGDLDNAAAALASMDAYLPAHGWRFRYCSTEEVEESLGGRLPTVWNVDVYGGRIAKLQRPPEGKYRGGIQLDLRLVMLEEAQELRTFIQAVLDAAKPLVASS